MPVATPEHLVGRALPEGTFTITAEENELLSEALETTPSDDGLAHPVFAYVATQRGIGVGIDEVFRLAECPMEDGPMLGSSELEFSAPLRVDVPYRVRGEITDIRRKEGGRIGTFDILTVREELVDENDLAVAVVCNAFILPRREEG
jgi:hypothetical protein